jgi:hypothetical protein
VPSTVFEQTPPLGTQLRQLLLLVVQSDGGGGGGQSRPFEKSIGTVSRLSHEGLLTLGQEGHIRATSWLWAAAGLLHDALPVTVAVPKSLQIAATACPQSPMKAPPVVWYRTLTEL